MSAPLYVGLVHYPIYDKNSNVVATAVTNYDLHDISRSSKTYGVKKYYLIHHIEGQVDMIQKYCHSGAAKPVGLTMLTARRPLISSRLKSA